MSRSYVVYDMRAALGDTDDAAVLGAFGHERPSRREIRECFGEGVLFSYRDQNGELVDEILEAIIEEAET